MATRQVMEVDQAVVIKRPFDLTVVARGRVPTSQWSEPILVASPIRDGCLELSFEAVPPHGPSLQVITPIAMSHTQAIPSKDAVKRVMIKTAENAISVDVADIWQWHESGTGQ
ncbi:MULTISPECIES: hypothetical protein [Roseateles]|uniref:Uncharacterized protein n=1 Tax=Pelomonas caseinilytica TaxID=2906763 RepID=A0ABS8XAQ0_9BURK|nr:MULTISPECIES: hypothetical protein [unclassified Roseateles]MCE4538009.1 hypothetical protein [Pelomonas sp. P7]HEV6965483.1 hypothetical protein [Roseateles sp.]